MHTLAGRTVVLGCLLVGSLSSGCGVTEDPAAAEEGVDAITVREGDYNLQTANGGGQPYTDIAVIGSRGFLAKGYEGLHVLDLRTMRVSQRIWDDRNRKRIPADALQVIGRNQILATWRGNRLGDLSDDRQYLFLNVFNTTSLTVSRTVAIDLSGTYEGTNGLSQLPNIATHLDTASNTLWIAFGHLDRPDRIYATEMPRANAELRLSALPGVETYGITNPHAVAVSGQRVYVPSSTDGLRVLNLDTGRHSVLATNLGYALDIAVNGTTGFVADHDGNVRVVNLTTGALLDSKELPGFSDGIHYSGGQVFAVWRNGVTVIRDRWPRR